VTHADGVERRGQRAKASDGAKVTNFTAKGQIEGGLHNCRVHGDILTGIMGAKGYEAQYTLDINVPLRYTS